MENKKQQAFIANLTTYTNTCSVIDSSLDGRRMIDQVKFCKQAILGSDPCTKTPQKKQEKPIDI